MVKAKDSSSSSRKKAKKASSPRAKKSRGKPSPGTRTSSRSAKRRSPKVSVNTDQEQLELERVEFLRAIDRYKRKTGKSFPTWTEVLDVLRSIGWLHPLEARALQESVPNEKTE